MVVALIAVFYLFMIKPQRDKEKKEAAYRDSLKAGDRLITAGGIHVKFVSRDGAMAIVEAAQGVRIKVQIATLRPIPEPAKTAKGQSKTFDTSREEEPRKREPLN